MYKGVALDIIDSIILDLFAGGYRNRKLQKFVENYHCDWSSRHPVLTESLCDHAHFRYRRSRFQNLNWNKAKDSKRWNRQTRPMAKAWGNDC